MHIEHIALGRLRHLLGQVRALQAAIVQGRAVVADGVTSGGKLSVEVVGAAAQHLACHFGVAEVFQAQVIELYRPRLTGKSLPHQSGSRVKVMVLPESILLTL